MNYNIILLIGLTLIIGGFLLFLYSEMKEREIDRRAAEDQKFADAVFRTQQLQNIRKDIRKWQLTKSREYIKFTIDTKRTYIKLYGREKARDKLSKIAFETSNGKDAKNYFVQESILYNQKSSPMKFVESNRRRKRERDRILDEISKSVRQFISDKLLLREIENKKDE